MWVSRDTHVISCHAILAPAQLVYEIKNDDSAGWNILKFQKNLYPRDQLNEIYQYRVVPEKLWKKGAP